MTKFKKGYNLRTIALFVTIGFCLNSAVYSIDLPVNHSLRVPLIGADNITIMKRYESSPYDPSEGAPEAFEEEVKDFIYTTYIASAWQLFKHLYYRYEGSEPISDDVKIAFIQLFKYHEIKNILDVGCEEGRFLALIQPLCEEAGIELYGIDLETKAPFYYNSEDERVEVGGITLYEGSAHQLSTHVGGKKFDIIFCSGVLGFIQLYMLAKNDAYNAYFDHAVKNSHKIVESAVRSLSDKPTSAFFAESFNSFFLLRKEALLRLSEVRILYWNTEEMIYRKETNGKGLESQLHLFPYAVHDIRSLDTVHELSLSRNRNHPRVKLYNLWKQSANVAVFQRKDVKSVHTKRLEKALVNGRNRETNQDI